VCHFIGACWTWIGSVLQWWCVKWSGLYFGGGLCPGFFHCFWGKKNPECLQHLLLTILSAFKEHCYPTIELLESEPLHWFSLNPIETEILFCVQQQAAASSIHKNAASSTLLEWIVFAMGLKDIIEQGVVAKHPTTTKANTQLLGRFHDPVFCLFWETRKLFANYCICVKCGTLVLEYHSEFLHKPWFIRALGPFIHLFSQTGN
jgi:hypothetical protein